MITEKSNQLQVIVITDYDYPNSDARTHSHTPMYVRTHAHTKYSITGCKYVNILCNCVSICIVLVLVYAYVFCEETY